MQARLMYYIIYITMIFSDIRISTTIVPRKILETTMNRQF